MQSRFLVAIFCICFAHPAFAVRDATSYILEKLEKQQEEQRLENERLQKYPPEQERQSRDPRSSKSPTTSNDPRNTSSTDAYPALRDREDDVDAKNICELNAVSSCMTAMNEGQATCQSELKTCTSSASKEHPSCKAYTCEMQKADCLRDVYVAYSACLAQGKAPQRVETNQPFSY